MRTGSILIAAVAAALLAACSPGGKQAGTDKAPATADDAATPAPTEAAVEQDACPDDGPRFPGTGLCIGRSVAYLPMDSSWEPPPNCRWEMKEAVFGDGSDALLFRAATCDGVATELEVSPGAHLASVNYVTSALGGEALAGMEVARLFVSDPADPQAHMKGIAAAQPAEEECGIRPAAVEGWPEDALVIAPSEAVRATLPQDEPAAACGEFGLDEDATQFWEVRQGYEWFFRLGQDAPDFDPFSMTHIVKGEDGSWSVAE